MTTPREQLIRTVHAEVCCPYGCDVAEHIADAIIAAGWTPPIPDTLNVLTEN